MLLSQTAISSSVVHLVRPQTASGGMTPVPLFTRGACLDGRLYRDISSGKKPGGGGTGGDVVVKNWWSEGMLVD